MMGCSINLRILTVLLVLAVVRTQENGGESNETIECSGGNSAKFLSSALDRLLQGYDRRVHPGTSDDPVDVSIGMNIVTLHSIRELEMDFTLDMFFRQTWLDKRLAYPCHRTIALSSALIDAIWMPDTYFVNSKKSTLHSLTKENKMIELVWPDGIVKYNIRVTVTATCPMDLRMFPFDFQRCYINIESYGYKTEHLLYHWEERTSVQMLPLAMSLPQFQFEGSQTTNKTSHYHVGDFSTLTVFFLFRRRVTYYLVQLYSPCSLIITLSWMSFWIRTDQTAARVGLGITSVLTITTLLSSLNYSMPKVSYVKAIDWYFIISFVFVFGVLVEYIIILICIKRHRVDRTGHPFRTDQPDNLDTSRSSSLDITERSHCARHRFHASSISFLPSGQHQAIAASPSPLPTAKLLLGVLPIDRIYSSRATLHSTETRAKIPLARREHATAAHVIGTCKTLHEARRAASRSRADHVKSTRAALYNMRLTRDKIPPRPVNAFDVPQEWEYELFDEHPVDRYSRVAFPLMYIVFNFVYWTFFYTEIWTS